MIPIVTSNIPKDNDILHHVSTYNNSSYFHAPTHSDTLVVRDLWLEGIFSRVLDSFYLHT